MIDRFKDNYEEPNYTRLFLLFILFLVSLYFWMGGVVEEHYMGGEEKQEIVGTVFLADRDL